MHTASCLYLRRVAFKGRGASFPLKPKVTPLEILLPEEALPPQIKNKKLYPTFDQKSKCIPDLHDVPMAGQYTIFSNIEVFFLLVKVVFKKTIIPIHNKHHDQVGIMHQLYHAISWSLKIIPIT